MALEKIDKRIFVLIGISIIINLITNSLVFLDISFIGEIGSNTLLSVYLRAATGIMGTPLLIILLHHVFSVAFTILFYFLVKTLFGDRDVALVSGMLFLLSPIYIRLFSSINVYFIPVSLLLLAVLLFEKKRFYFAVPLLALSSANYAFLALSLAIAGYYSIHKKSGIAYAYSALALSCFLYLSFFIFNFDFSLYFFPAINISDILFEFSNNLSVTGTVFLFSFIGAFMLGYKKKPEVRHLMLVVYAFISVGFSLASKYFIASLFVFVLPFAGLAFCRIFSYEWKRKDLKVASVVLITYLILVPVVISIARLGDRVESNREFEELMSLRQVGSSKVFAPIKYNCIVSEVLRQKTLFKNPLCSDFYTQDTDLIRGTLERHNKTLLFTEKKGIASYSEFETHQSFYEIYNMPAFKSYISENNVSLIVLSLHEINKIKNENENLFLILDSLNITETSTRLRVFDAQQLTSS
ncbi:MAG TPA: hypothetical protein ENN46_00055 [Candidatus Woesearchaeota archaeon]|nr:hypothetical protein [Candidatus Woesearchaeota archaeon]